ncbi:hypothetical protein [Stakelama tenebrarum]|uniref:Uncharacterized protein n=1 Tax=Stakelama tenebrarum TaxID=2711215 RepID=A0A6G6Y871_9SPHN|nr:hypothetical protein [Sphingosinithalassobacter tenebrarum]QIG80997.1 hypothetical protein G5C33_15165 [Sphingosinithalassobacter tenebrarum]
MLGAPKPTASLSSGLLARKGQARPAMRPQGYVGLTPPTQHDDLGWNDMGEDHVHVPSSVQPLTPAPAPTEPPVPAPRPAVLRQRDALDRELAGDAEPTESPEAEEPVIDAPIFGATAFETPALNVPEVPEAVVTAPVSHEPAAKAPEPEAATLSSEAAERVAREMHRKKRRAAFTLRLDPERHLRLRLASALSNRSAQQIVTEALDAFLESQQAVDALVDQLDRQPRRKD